MKLLPSRTLVTTATGLAAGLSLSAIQACDDGDGSGLGNIAEQCDLKCPDKGIVEGNAQISGIVEIDAFFGAVIDVTGAAASVSANIQAELDAIALSLDLPKGSTGAEIKAALEAKIKANVDGELTVNAQPAKCSASVEVSAKAAAECDAEVDPGKVEVKCQGSCQVDASAKVDCGAEAKVVCTGTAPELKCEGTCSGSCQLDVAAACEGSCGGECDGECTACAGGTCNKMGGVVTNCEGQCMGMCKGSCKLEAGGSCSGKCEGSCEWTPPKGAMCEANVEAKCEAMGDASVDCQGKCEGTAEPPKVKASCEASVEAKANASVECTPPSLDIQFQWKAGVDADAQAEFKAWLTTFKTRYAALLAASAKAKIVVKGLGGLTAAATGAVQGGVDAALKGGLKAKIGAGCAATELEAVGKVLGDASTKLEASASAVVDVTAAIGG